MAKNLPEEFVKLEGILHLCRRTKGRSEITARTISHLLHVVPLVCKAISLQVFDFQLNRSH